MTEDRPPAITHLSWGQMGVEGHDRTFKDVKTWPGGARAWDWDETGTSHSPGIQPADVQELLDHGAEHVILTKGMNQRLETQPKTVSWLEQEGVEVEILQTEQAVERYNELVDAGDMVGGLFHSTC